MRWCSRPGRRWPIPWRNHYDRLHLHTVKQQSQLPGLPFAKELPRYVSRADFVAYLEAYAAHFSIVPRTGEAVRRVGAADGGFVVESARAVYRARAVVVATGYSRVPNPERLPEQERFRGPVVHSSSYRNAEGFAGQRVLVVGAGNTGAEIALDLANCGAKPTLTVRAPVNVVPRDLLGMPIQLTSIRMRKAPLKVADGIGRLASRLAVGNLTCGSDSRGRRWGRSRRSNCGSASRSSTSAPGCDQAWSEGGQGRASRASPRRAPCSPTTAWPSSTWSCWSPASGAALEDFVAVPGRP